jgi:hypothetical protein
MPKPVDVKIQLGPFSGGLYDHGDKEDTPRDAFREVLGFQWKDAPFPQSENGRVQHTGPEVFASKKLDKVLRWRDQSGTQKLIVACNGTLYSGTEPTGDTGATIDTIINTIDCGQTAATRDADTVTLLGPNVNVSRTLKAGTDRFWFTVDGIAQAATIQTFVGDTGFTVSTYGGSEDESSTADGIIIERHLGSTIDMALFDGRVAVTDGVLRPHYYGATKDGETNYTFREMGLAQPFKAPELSLAGTLGGLSAGDYTYWYSVEDPRGVESNPIQMQRVTATANQTATLAAIPDASHAATRCRVYRTLVNGSSGYSIHPDIGARRVASATSDGTTSDIRLNTAADTLTNSQHVFRMLQYRATSNEYVIKANNGDTITIFGDNSSESETDDVLISGGVNLQYAQTGDIADVTLDTDLDFFRPAPTQVIVTGGTARYQNDQGSTAASLITSFRSEGRLAWVVNNSEVEFSGRPFTAYRPAGVPTSGEGPHKPEFEYSQIHHDLNGNDNVETVALWSMGRELYAGREDGIWGLRAPSPEVTGWLWEQRVNQYGIVAREGVSVYNTAAFCVANRAGEMDVILFNGFEAISIGRDRLDATLDEIVNPADITTTIFQRVFYMSYTKSGGSTHDRLIGYYIDRRIWDKQPWGCGTFLTPYRSGDDFYLYCAAPTALGHLYQVFGAAQDLGGVIQRLLRTGRIMSESGDKVEWASVEAKVKGE